MEKERIINGKAIKIITTKKEDCTERIYKTNSENIREVEQNNGVVDFWGKTWRNDYQNPYKYNNRVSLHRKTVNGKIERDFEEGIIVDKEKKIIAGEYSEEVKVNENGTHETFRSKIMEDESKLYNFTLKEIRESDKLHVEKALKITDKLTRLQEHRTLIVDEAYSPYSPGQDTYNIRCKIELDGKLATEISQSNKCTVINEYGKDGFSDTFVYGPEGYPIIKKPDLEKLPGPYASRLFNEDTFKFMNLGYVQSHEIFECMGVEKKEQSQQNQDQRETRADNEER